MNKRELLKKVFNSKNNIIVNGRINSRKTYGVMFPLMDIIADSGESFFVLDSKEEYFKRYYNDLKKAGYETVIINLRNPLASDGWNPLTYAYSLYCSNHIDSSTRSLEKIADVLFDTQVEDRFWAVSSKNLFLGIVWFLFENAKEYEINFNSVVELLDSFADNEALFSGDSHSARLLRSISKAPRETKGSVISIVRQELTKFTNYPNLSKLLATPMKKLDLGRKFAIFFINRDEDLYFNSLSAVFIDQFYDYLQKSNYNLPFNFILDNYETIVDDYTNLDLLLYSGPSRKVRTIICTGENLDYLDNVCERIESTEESVRFNINSEDQETNNDYERVDFNQIVKYPQLKCDGIKVFNYAKKPSSYDFSFITNKIDDEIKRLEREAKNGIDFTTFINTHNFDDLIINENADNDFLKFINENNFDYLAKEQEDLSELIKSIDEEIARLEKEGISREKNDFEKFLEENSFEDLFNTLYREKEEDTFEQLLEAIDKEIALLEEKVTDENKNDFADIIKRIDEEIERLEKEEDVKEDAYNTRNDFIEFLNSHNFDDVVAGEFDNKIDEEVANLTEEETNSYINDIERKIDEELQGLTAKVEKENDFLKFINGYTSPCDEELKKLVDSIDEEINKIKKSGPTREKNDFEKFLETYTAKELDKAIDEDVEYKQLLDALDKEIDLLSNKVDDSNKDDFADIIRRIDEEIERLEKVTPEEASKARNEFMDFLNSHNFEEVLENPENYEFSVPSDFESLSREIDDEIAKLELAEADEDEARVIEIQ